MKKPIKNIKKKIKKKIPFAKLPDWKQRVEIAKDVLLQIKANTFKPEQGTYLDINSTAKGRDKENVWDMQANTAVKQKLATCHVCAKGAIFMSHIMKTNHCSLIDADATRERDYIDRLTMFSQGQLDTIECAFECGVVQDREKILKDAYGNRTPLADRTIDFCSSLDSPNRLIKIMQNIIKNKGTFNP